MQKRTCPTFGRNGPVTFLPFLLLKIQKKKLVSSLSDLFFCHCLSKTNHTKLNNAKLSVCQKQVGDCFKTGSIRNKHQFSETNPTLTTNGYPTWKLVNPNAACQEMICAVCVCSSNISHTSLCDKTKAAHRSLLSNRIGEDNYVTGTIEGNPEAPRFHDPCHSCVTYGFFDSTKHCVMLFRDEAENKTKQNEQRILFTSLGSFYLRAKSRVGLGVLMWKRRCRKSSSLCEVGNLSIPNVEKATLAIILGCEFHKHFSYLADHAFFCWAKQNHGFT